MKIGIEAKWLFDGPPSGQRVVANLVRSFADVASDHELHLFLDARSRGEPVPADIPDRPTTLRVGEEQPARECLRRPARRGPRRPRCRRLPELRAAAESGAPRARGVRARRDLRVASGVLHAAGAPLLQAAALPDASCRPRVHRVRMRTLAARPLRVRDGRSRRRRSEWRRRSVRASRAPAGHGIGAGARPVRRARALRALRRPSQRAKERRRARSRRSPISRAPVCSCSSPAPPTRPRRISRASPPPRASRIASACSAA